MYLYQLVQRWVNGTITNYGLVLEDDMNANWWGPGPIDTEQLNEIEVLFSRNNVYLQVTASMVPEPSTMFLFALGGSALALYNRRKRKN